MRGNVVVMRSQLALLLGGLAVLAPVEARASESMPGLGEAIVQAMNDFSLNSQFQIGAAGVMTGGPRFGGTELRATLTMVGIGGSLGGRFETYPHGGQGGLGFVDLQLRPVGALSQFYRILDPYLSVGGELGGGSRGLRAAQTLGVGLDIGLFGGKKSNPSGMHPAITLRYQFRTVQTPDDLPSHLVHLGASFRTVF